MEFMSLNDNKDIGQTNVPDVKKTQQSVLECKLYDVHISCVANIAHNTNLENYKMIWKKRSVTALIWRKYGVNFKYALFIWCDQEPDKAYHYMDGLVIRASKSERVPAYTCRLWRHTSTGITCIYSANLEVTTMDHGANMLCERFILELVNKLQQRIVFGVSKMEGYINSNAYAGLREETSRLRQSFKDGHRIGQKLLGYVFKSEKDCDDILMVGYDRKYVKECIQNGWKKEKSWLEKNLLVAEKYWLSNIGETLCELKILCNTATSLDVLLVVEYLMGWPLRPEMEFREKYPELRRRILLEEEDLFLVPSPDKTCDPNPTPNKLCGYKLHFEYNYEENMRRLQKKWKEDLLAFAKSMKIEDMPLADIYGVIEYITGWGLEYDMIPSPAKYTDYFCTEILRLREGLLNGEENLSLFGYLFDNKLSFEENVQLAKEFWLSDIDRFRCVMQKRINSDIFLITCVEKSLPWAPLPPPVKSEWCIRCEEYDYSSHIVGWKGSRQDTAIYSCSSD